MRFQIKKLLEGYDPADLIEQSMYCFGSDDGGGGGDSSSMGMDDDVSAQASVTDTSSSNNNSSDQDNFNNMDNFSYPNAQNFSTNLTNAPEIGLDAFGGIGGALSTQSTAGMQSSAGDMLGGSMSITDPNTGITTSFSPTQVPSLETMPSIGYDPFGMRNKINNIIEDRDKQGLYTQVTRDAMGNVTGAFNNAPMFGLGFMPNVTTYTGLDQNPYNEDMSYMDSNENAPATVAPTTNPVSGQPVCPDGYKFDNDLQACRLDTAKPNMGSGTMASGDAFYRATSLDQAPMNVPSGFDFNRANQDFVSQFAYRPANFTNQMSLTGFTPFRRS